MTSLEVSTRTWCICAVTYWSARGTYYLVKGAFIITDKKFQHSLFPGLCAFLIIFIMFSASSYLQRDYFISLLSLSMVIACAFEIASLWHCMPIAVATSYIMPGVLLILRVMRGLKDYTLPRPHRTSEKNTDHDVTKLYFVVGQVTSVICYAVYACSVVGTHISPSYSFPWLTSSAVVMLLCSVIALRHQDTVFGSFYGLSGAFWLSVAYSEFLIFADKVDILKFITGDAAGSSASLVAVYVCCSVAFLILAVTFFNKQIFQSLQCLLLFFFSIGKCVHKIEATYIGVIGWMAFLLSLYGVLAHLFVNKTHHKAIPLGKNFFKTNLGKSIYSKISTGVRKHDRGSTNKGKISSDAMLGYSKYADVELVGFGSNATAALSILWVPTESLVFSLPWVVGVGGVLQFLVGCVCYSRGKTFESCSFIIYSIFWAVWGPIRCLSISDDFDHFGMSIGCIAFIVVSVAMSFISLSVNKAWTVMSIMFSLLVFSFLLSSMKVSSTDAFEKVVILLFACICLYCFSAATVKAIWKRDLLWLGRPILPLSYLHTQAQDASWMDANKASGVTAIAGNFRQDFTNYS